MNRLYNMRAYLCGAMDRVADGGVEWRERISEHLIERGVTPLNPCNKPIDLGIEDAEVREQITEWKHAGEFEKIRKKRVIRNVDLRMVDLSDFIYVRWDQDQFLCGTQEEVVTANRQKKPIIVVIPQGLWEMANWMFWECDYTMFFNNDNDALAYLDHVDTAPASEVEHRKRWFFFNIKSPLRLRMENRLKQICNNYIEKYRVPLYRDKDIENMSDDELIIGFETVVKCVEARMNLNVWGE
jgi:hypothetical protein